MKEKGRITFTFLFILLIIGAGVYFVVKTVPVYIKWTEIKGVVETNLKRSFMNYEEFEKAVIDKWKEMNLDLSEITFSRLEGDEIYLSYTKEVIYFGRWSYPFKFEFRAQFKAGEE
jgi:uncharacterized membrane protein